MPGFSGQVQYNSTSHISSPPGLYFQITQQDSVSKDKPLLVFGGKKARPHMPSSLWTAHNTGEESG